MKVVFRLIRVLYEPFKVFTEMEEKPSPLFPFLAVIVLSVALYVLTFPSTYEWVLEKMMERVRELPPDQQEKAGQIYTFGRMYIGGAVSILVALPLKMLAQAGIFLLIFLLIGEQISFKGSLTSIAYANWVSFIGNLCKTPLILTKKSYDIHTDLTLFFPSMERKFIYKLLSKVDFFTIFSLIILSIGLAVFGKIERKKVLILVFILWLVFITLSSLLPTGTRGV